MKKTEVNEKMVKKVNSIITTIPNLVNRIEIFNANNDQSDVKRLEEHILTIIHTLLPTIETFEGYPAIKELVKNEEDLLGKVKQDIKLELDHPDKIPEISKEIIQLLRILEEIGIKELKVLQEK